MKTIIASALGILFLAGPIESAQPMPIMPTWSNRRLIEQDRARKEAARKAYENSPEGIRQELARLRAQQAEMQRQQNRDRMDARLQQQEREAQESAEFTRRNWEIQRRQQQGTTRR